MEVLRLGLIGTPVYHSMSPTIYSELFRMHGIHGSYSVIDVTPAMLPSIRDIAAARALSAFSVTMPHKSRIIEYVDSLAPSAKSSCSINLVTCKNNLLVGHSTDGVGFLRSLKNSLGNVKLSSLKLVLFGTGGAARSLLCSLTNETNNIVVVGRDLDKARLLANEFGVAFAKDICPCDVFINATPLGMNGFLNFDCFDFLKHVSCYVFDLVYSPAQTALLAMAKEFGLGCKNGMSMLIAQAEEALSIVLKA